MVGQRGSFFNRASSHRIFSSPQPCPSTTSMSQKTYLRFSFHSWLSPRLELHGEYLVPCVLGVNKIYPPLPVVEGNIRSYFILHFSKKSPMFGVYCCTTSYLMSESGWKPLTEGGEVVQMARNSITFEIPTSIPGVAVTLKDPLSSYLEVVVELPHPFAAKHSKAVFPKIRDTLLDAVRKAMKNLRYTVITPDLTFLCPESNQANARCSKRPHPSTLIESENLLMCTHKPKNVFHSVTEEQKMWLPKATGE